MIDIFVLQEAAFNTPNQFGTTLRSILESAQVPKVFFDVRNDADALYAHFNISLRGVHDIQLLEVATRSRAKDRVVGLGKCIKFDARLTAEAQQDWEAIKGRGKALFNTKDGGSFEVFNTRPIPQDIVDYCAHDVVYLPVLWNVYSQKIGKKWLKRVQEETVKRVLMSQAESYDPHGEHKVLSPWVNTAKDGKRKCPRKTGVKEIEKKGIIGVRNMERRGKVSGLQVIAAKAAHRKAEKQLGESLIRQWSIEDIEPQASKQMAHLIAARVTPTVINVMLERPFPLVDLRIRSKAATHGKAVDPGWTCTTCSRVMLKTQRQDHLAGQAHIARLKQVPITASSPPVQPTTAKEEYPQAATIGTTRSRKPKAKPATKSQQGNPSQVAPRSTNRRSGAATTFTYTQSSTPFSSDLGFVGFKQDWSAANSSYGAYYPEGGDDYGLCDKDCGWCGYCMNGIDI